MSDEEFDAEKIAERKKEDDQAKAEERREGEQKQEDEAKQELKDLEEDPPENLEDWPDGKAKYETFGGEEHESSYDEAATSKLGPSSVRHHEDGDVSVGGEKVDDPDEYKAGEDSTDDPMDLSNIKTREDKKEELGIGDEGVPHKGGNPTEKGGNDSDEDDSKDEDPKEED